jgi:(R,R)-butanediol dehydrogenase/meso-butanediol dehydrogenase/diacetyl reductase/L-iditol 2-dehydrogenase
MKAVVLKEVNLIEVQDIPEPEPSPNEIKVKIAYAGICGTDPKIVEGAIGSTSPEGIIGKPRKAIQKSDFVRIMSAGMREGIMILGHEASGTVVKIGKDIKGDFKVGQRVTMNMSSPCGVCYYCTRGMANYCERNAPLPGAMAEYAVYRENTVFPLPDEVPFDVGAFCEPACIALHSVEVARMQLGDSVIITGGGPIGLLIMELAIKSGASKVLVVEPIAEKRKLAKQLGADVVVDPLNEDLLEISNKFTGGRGYSVSFEASGKAAVARQLILLAERGGTIVWAATYHGILDMGFPLAYVQGRALTIHTITTSPYSFPKALQMLPKLDIKPLITVYPLTEAIKAFEANKSGKDVKIMLQP